MTPHDDRCVVESTAHDQRKRFETARAVAACRGYELRQIINSQGPNAYIVSRWNLCRELADLDAVDRFLGQVGATR